jgi:serine/threonine-protein kinase
MTEVVLAERTRPDGTLEPIVVKRVLPAMKEEPAFVEHFVEESALALRFDHPNIVRALDAGVIDGLPFLVMERLEGVDLRIVLRHLEARGRGLSPAVACGIGAGIASGLVYAHAVADDDGPLHVVHRDISPHNVFVTTEGEVKILDFDIAATGVHDSPRRARWSPVMGKVAYMAPEALGGLDIDCRSDLFALGVVLWELLVGKRLWKRDDEEATRRAIREESALPPSVAAPGVPRIVDPAVMGLLSKFPCSRPSCASDIANVLHRIAASLGAGSDTDRARAIAAEILPFTGPPA